MPESIGLRGELDLDQWNKAVDSYLGSVSKMESVTAKAVGALGAEYSKLGGVIAAGIGAATAAVAGLTVVGARELTNWTADGVKSAIELEQKIADIAAVLGQTSEAVAPLDRLISDLALNPKLTVDANGAADAMEMLARNGLNMSEIMEGAAEQTIFLANATKADFGTAADVVTDILGAFNLKVKDLGRAVDITSGVVNSSKFSIDDWRLALAQGGGVAGALGVELEDFATIIAGTSSLFGSGSDAGTAFKTMLQRLVPQSQEAADTMRDLGLYSGLTGKEFEKTQEKIEKTRKKIAELDPTSKNYAKRLDELTGELRGLERELVAGTNAFFDQNGQMKSGEEIARILWEATKNLSEEQKTAALNTIFGTDAIRMAIGVANLGAGSYQEYAAQVTAAGQAQQSAETRTATLAAKLEKLNDIMDEIQRQSGKQFFDLLGRIADKLIEIASENSDRIIAFFEALADLGETLFEKFEPWVDEQLPKLLDNLEALARWLVEVAASGDRNNEWLDRMTPGFRDLVERVLSAIEGFGRFRDALNEVIDKVQAVIAPLANWVSENIELEDALMAATGAVAAFLVPLATAITKLGLIGAAATLAVSTIRTAWEDDFAGIRSAFEELWPKLEEPINNLVKKLSSGDWEGAWAEAQRIVVTTIEEIQKHTPKLLDDILEVIKQLTLGNWSDAWQKAQEAATEAIREISKKWGEWQEALETFFSEEGGGAEIVKWFDENFPESVASTQTAIENLGDSFEDFFRELEQQLAAARRFWEQHGHQVVAVLDFTIGEAIDNFATALSAYMDLASAMNNVLQGNLAEARRLWIEAQDKFDDLRKRQTQRSLNLITAMTEEHLDRLAVALRDGGQEAADAFLASFDQMVADMGPRAASMELTMRTIGADGMLAFSEEIARNPAPFDAIDGFIADVGEYIVAVRGGFVTAGEESVRSYVQAFAEKRGLGQDAANAMADAVIEGLISGVQTQTPLVEQSGKAAGDAAATGMAKGIDEGKTVIEESSRRSGGAATSGFRKGVEETSDEAVGAVEAMVDQVSDAGAALPEQFAGHGAALVNNLTGEILFKSSEPVASVQEMIRLMLNEGATLPPGFKDFGSLSIENLGKGVDENAHVAVEAFDRVIEPLAGSGSKLPGEFEKTGAESVGALGTGAEVAKTPTLGIFEGVANEAHDRMSNLVTFMEMVGEAAISRLAMPIQEKGPVILGQALATVMEGAATYIDNALKSFSAKGEQAMISLAAGMETGIQPVASVLARLADQILTILAPLMDKFSTAGSMSMEKMSQGMAQAASNVLTTLGDILAQVVQAATRALELDSPPGVLGRLGFQLVDGFHKVLQAELPTVQRTISEFLQEVSDEFKRRLEEVLAQAVANMESMREQVVAAIDAMKEGVTALVQLMGEDMIAAIEESTDTATKRFQQFGQEATKVVQELTSKVSAAIGKMTGDFNRDIEQATQNAINKFNQMSSSVVSTVNSMGSQIVATANTTKNNFVAVFNDLVNQVADRFRGMADAVRGAVNVNAFEGIGRDIAQGFINGVNNKIGEAQAKVQELVNLAAQAAEQAAQIASPSKVFMRIGLLSGEGYVVGLDKTLANVRERVYDALNFGDMDITVNRMVQQRIAAVSAASPALAPVRGISTVNNSSVTFGPNHISTPMDLAEFRHIIRQEMNAVRVR